MNALRTSVTLFAFIATASTANAQRFELTGSQVAIYNLAGSIRLESGTGRSVVVEVERAGRDAQRLSVRTDAINGVPTLRVIYPGDEIVAPDMEGRSQTTITVNEDGTFGRSRGGRRVRITSGRDRDGLHAEARIIVRVPAGVTVDANLAIGDMTATGVASDLDLNTSAGNISSERQRGKLNASTASGDITVATAQGDLFLETASGTVEVNGATSQRIKADAASGGIRLTDVTSQNIDVESASGSVRVVRARAPNIKASTASGSVRVDVDGEVRDVEISTASGSAEATLPADFSGEVELETASGNVDVDFALNVVRQRRNHVRGTVGQGGSARVSISAASGDVSLRRR